MSRAPASSQARLPTEAPVLVALLLLGLATTLAGCGEGQGDRTPPAGPSKQALECREEWKALEPDVAGRDSATSPSALASRWNSVAATIDYYATSASPDDCGETLTAQRAAIDDLARFGKRLERYDMPLRLDQVRTEAEAYASGPRPPAPEPKVRRKAAPRPPRPADVAAALRTLTAQAPRATQQQLPAWQQARVTELSEKSSVRKAVKDLAFLSGESKAYRACTRALAQIRKALIATSG